MQLGGGAAFCGWENERRKMTEQKNTGKIIIALTVVVVGALLVLALIILFGSSETRISTKSPEGTISVLDCKSYSPSDPFFDRETEIRAEHRVKAKYSNEVFDGFDYTYTGTYNSADAAEEAISWLHADYNKYMSETGVNQEDLSPTFSAIKSDAVINIYLPTQYLNSGTAKLIFIGSNEFAGLKNKTIDEMKKLYEGKDFSCTITN